MSGYPNHPNHPNHPNQQQMQQQMLYQQQQQQQQMMMSRQQPGQQMHMNYGMGGNQQSNDVYMQQPQHYSNQGNVQSGVNPQLYSNLNQSSHIQPRSPYSIGPSSQGGPHSLGGPLSVPQGGPLSVNQPGGPMSVNQQGGPMSVNQQGGPMSVNQQGGPHSVNQQGGPHSVNQPGGPMSVNQQSGPLSVGSCQQVMNTSSLQGGPSSVQGPQSHGGPLSVSANPLSVQGAPSSVNPSTPFNTSINTPSKQMNNQSTVDENTTAWVDSISILSDPLTLSKGLITKDLRISFMEMNKSMAELLKAKGDTPSESVCSKYTNDYNEFMAVCDQVEQALTVVLETSKMMSKLDRSYASDQPQMQRSNEYTTQPIIKYIEETNHITSKIDSTVSGVFEMMSKIRKREALSKNEGQIDKVGMNKDNEPYGLEEEDDEDEEMSL